MANPSKVTPTVIQNLAASDEGDMADDCKKGSRYDSLRLLM
jgi:hypothetical protein